MTSEAFLVDALLDVLEDAAVVVGEVEVLVLLEGAVHDLEELLLAGVVDLADLGLDLVEPVFDGVQLRRVGRQVQDLHPALAAQVHRLLLVVDGAVVQHQPLLTLLLLAGPLLLSQLLLLLAQAGEELLDEVEVLVLAVGALDDAPVGESVVGDDGDEGEALALGDGAVDRDLLVGTRPGLVAGHVEVEAALVQEVHLRVLLKDLLVLTAVVESLLQRLGRVPFLGHALHTFLLELPHLQQPRYCRTGDLNPLAILDVLEVLDLVQFDRELVLREEGVLLDEAGDVFEPFQRDFPFGCLGLQVLAVDAFVETGVLHPLGVQLVDGAVSHVEQLSDLADIDLRPLQVVVVLEGVELVEFLGQQLQRLLGETFPPVLAEAFQTATAVGVNVQVLEFLLLLLHLVLLLLQLLLDPPCLLLHVLPLLLIVLPALVTQPACPTLPLSPQRLH